MITAHPTVRQVMTTKLVAARESTTSKELVRLPASIKTDEKRVRSGGGWPYEPPPDVDREGPK